MGNVLKRSTRQELEDRLAADLTHSIVQHDPLIRSSAAEIAGRLAGKIASEVAVLTQSIQRSLPHARDSLDSIAAECVANLIDHAAMGIGQPKPRKLLNASHTQPSEAFSDVVTDWAGVMAGPSDIERHFGIPRSTLFRWQKRNEVISIRTGAKRFGFPLDQFVDGRPMSGIREVILVFADARAAWRWLLTPSAVLKGVLPFEKLKKGDIDTVVQAAIAAAEI